MDIKVYSRVIQMVKQIIDPYSKTQPCVETKPDKPAFVPVPVEQPFPRCKPEKKGVRSEMLYSFIDELRSDKTLDMHQVTVIKDGAVILEAPFGAYRTDIWHITHSMCKSLTGLAVGMLIDDGKLTLDTKVIKILDKHTNLMSQVLQKGMTVRHLLTMTSGVAFGETGSVTETEWAKAFFESAMLSAPGDSFNYNSMNSYILSVIVQEISGQSLFDFLNERLFTPLGIKNIFWEKSPEGTAKGGWGLYILPEDIAKVGQLLLDKGVWKGKRILSEEWVREATSPKVITQESFGDYNYGYHIWVGRGSTRFLFNGMFGQNVLCFPDTGIIIASNAGNNELFQQSGFFRVVHKYFGSEYKPGKTLPPDKRAYRKLKKLVSSLSKNNLPYMERIRIALLTSRMKKKLDGEKYRITSPNSVSFGLLPEMAQILQNNYSGGLEGFSFSIENKKFLVKIKESDAEYIFPVGLSAPEYTDITMHGEPYKVGVTGMFSTDENLLPVLKLRFSFVETSNSRFINIHFDGDKITAKCSELPGRDYLYGGLKAIENQLSDNKFIKLLSVKPDNDYIMFLADRVCEPVLEGQKQKK